MDTDEGVGPRRASSGSNPHFLFRLAGAGPGGGTRGWRGKRIVERVFAYGASLIQVYWMHLRQLEWCSARVLTAKELFRSRARDSGRAEGRERWPRMDAE
jgi:hypothetical protein